jgi:hypothetical protein
MCPSYVDCKEATKISVYQERNSMRISEYQKVYQKAYRARKKLEKLNNA